MQRVFHYFHCVNIEYKQKMYNPLDSVTSMINLNCHIKYGKTFPLEDKSHIGGKSLLNNIMHGNYDFKIDVFRLPSIHFMSTVIFKILGMFNL